MSGVEGGKGTCYQWKEKGQCSKGDQCSFRHESGDRAPKPDHNAATPSEPSLPRGRSVSKKRSIQGKSNHGAILRQPCRYSLKCTCTRSPCEYWHPPECHFYKTETGCKAGDRCMFPHHKVDEQPNTKPKKGYYVSQDSDALVCQRGKEPRGNPMQKVLGPIRKIRFTKSTPRQASIQEKKGPSHGKLQVKHPHQRSRYAVKFEDRSQEETERQQRCARSKAWNLAKNMYKLKEKDKATFYSALERMGTPGCVNKRAGRKRVCGRFRSKYAYGQQARPKLR